MKKIIISIIMMLACVNNSSIHAQNVVREGNTFKSVSTRNTTKADTLVTKYTFQDRQGTNYPIIINIGSGSCYVWKKSKSNRLYKQYMKVEISQTICKELGIEYKSKSKK